MYAFRPVWMQGDFRHVFRVVRPGNDNSALRNARDIQ